MLAALGCGGGGSMTVPPPGGNQNPPVGPQPSPALDAGLIYASVNATSGLFLLTGDPGAAAGGAQVLARDKNQITLSTFATGDGRIGATGGEAPPGFDTSAGSTLTITQVVPGYAESAPVTVTILAEIDPLPLPLPFPGP
jgi:hypothetical protein